ncbi:hypothetical protein [Rhodoferax sp.]|uniref:hypothetical protein n=1 Tax=Rhodoferax sp. TaxID=50421 RepID=UPI00261CF6EC|nr:hypothetical protein [Rhodoferax sp.]MDD2808874.1 hypothetical protein [Rhodoferax sp.]MDD4943883.1 hypothetical protein [Rhodoferax sp.]
MLLAQGFEFAPVNEFNTRVVSIDPTKAQIDHDVLAMFDLGLDSKLRVCDLVKLKVRDISHGDRVTTAAKPQARPPLAPWCWCAFSSTASRFVTSTPNPCCVPSLTRCACQTAVL